jgi:hypothetical protein
MDMGVGGCRGKCLWGRKEDKVVAEEEEEGGEGIRTRQRHMPCAAAQQVKEGVECIPPAAHVLLHTHTPT